MKPLVLIIDNDLAFRESLHDDLLRVGFYAFIGSEGNASSILQRLKPDALLISADLDNGAAFAEVSRLRQDAVAGNLPIVMYSVSTQLMDKARGLDVGADDFVSKPFSIEALVMRIHGLLRHGGGDANREIVEIGDLRVDMRGYSVAYEDRSIDLSQTLFSLLCLLVHQPDKVFTREQIRDAVWGKDSCISERSVDVYMNRLRQNMGDEARDMIKTVRGIGYKLSTNKSARGAASGNGGFRRESDKRLLIPVIDAVAHAF